MRNILALCSSLVNLGSAAVQTKTASYFSRKTRKNSLYANNVSSLSSRWLYSFVALRLLSEYSHHRIYLRAQAQGSSLQKMLRTLLFDGLYTDSESQRATALDTIVDTIRKWATSMDSTSITLQYPPPPTIAIDEMEWLRLHLLILLRMSINCPFHDVRSRFTELLRELEVHYYIQALSLFIYNYIVYIRPPRIPESKYQGPSMILPHSSYPRINSLISVQRLM